jgi:Glycosyl hydrolases family 2, sugar binding domain
LIEPWGTVFVVFRKSTTEKSHSVPKLTETKLASVEGPWQVAFQSGRGAPPSITMGTLTAWNESSDPGVKYFGGVGTYTKTIQASADWFSKGSHLWLVLGDVKNLAEVSVNGKDLGVAWHAPYRIDVTSAHKPGKNDVVIKVVNAWVNRFIGDEQPGATKITFADVKPYKAKSPLLPSGLLGSVAVVRSEAK